MDFLQLPVATGSFVRTVNGATLSGTVTHNQLELVTGYGPYGYGYKALIAAASLTYDMKFTHRIPLDPAPLSLPQVAPDAADRERERNWRSERQWWICP